MSWAGCCGEFCLGQEFLTEGVAPPTPPTGPLIINGWYTDSKGGIYYYYKTPDGKPGPRPPVTV